MEILKTISLIIMLITTSVNSSTSSLMENISFDNNLNVENYTVYQDFYYDINNDDVDDYIAIYTSAEKDENGNFMWDDGQNWSFIAEIDGNKYNLYSAYLHGDMDFKMMELYKGEEVIPCIQLSINEWAGIRLYHYIYDKENNIFSKELVYNTDEYSDNGINVMNN